MNVDLLRVFESHASRWYDAWSGVMQEKHPATVRSHERFLELVRRLPTHVRLRLGLALHRGRLVASSLPGRGHYVGPPNGRMSSMLTRRPLGDDRHEVALCGEMFVHLAEYASLDAMRRVYTELDVEIEDEWMDLTVRRGRELIAYVEVKRDIDDAQRLVRGLAELQGCDVPTTSKNDAERKANYIIDAAPSRPIAFSVRAGDWKNDGILECGWTATVHGRRLDLEPHEDPVPLRVELDTLTEPRARALACMVWSLERAAPVVVDRGSVDSYLVYEARGDQTPVLIGTERNLGLYTVLEGFGEERLQRFLSCLRDFGMCLGRDPEPKAHRVWANLDGSRAFLDDEVRARELGRQLAEVLSTSP